MTPSTIYEPLDLASQQIRLMRITSAADSELIGCDLHTFDLSSAPSYIALSYAWGPPTPLRSIWINRDWNVALELRVRQNLHSCLQVLKTSDYYKYVWIDQVCIQQGNVLEKNHQLKHMGEIYSKVHEVDELV